VVDVAEKEESSDSRFFVTFDQVERLQPCHFVSATPVDTRWLDRGRDGRRSQKLPPQKRGLERGPFTNTNLTFKFHLYFITRALKLYYNLRNLKQINSRCLIESLI
jgi:hypothetical protein